MFIKTYFGLELNVIHKIIENILKEKAMHGVTICIKLSLKLQNVSRLLKEMKLKVRASDDTRRNGGTEVV